MERRADGQPDHRAAALERDPLSNNGINAAMLWLEAVRRRFAAPIWMTCRRAKKLGAFVRKGGTGSMVVFASTFRKEEQDEKTGEMVEQDIPFVKLCTLSNVEQIDGLPDHCDAPAAPVLGPLALVERAEAFVAESDADIRPGGDMACYSVAIDRIGGAGFEAFRELRNLYSTLPQELSYRTRPFSRLGRGQRHVWHT